jgi:hypothetical protein
MDDALVDKVASAMWDAFEGVAWHFSELDENQQAQFRGMARAAIAVLATSEIDAAGLDPLHGKKT